MDIKRINDEVSVSGQLSQEELEQLAAQGVRSIICNRPDLENEAAPRQTFQKMQQRARQLGMELYYVPVIHDRISAADVDRFARVYESSDKPLHAYCRTGLRSVTLWTLMQIRNGHNTDAAISTASQIGYDFSSFKSKFAPVLDTFPAGATGPGSSQDCDVAIIGAGAAGISVAASLLARSPELHIVLIDAAAKHYYQPGFTLVGGGVFSAEQTVRDMQSLIPAKASWIQAAAAHIDPHGNQIQLSNGNRLNYQRLVVCPGLKLHWQGVQGLEQTLGQNGVTSNYHPDYAAYTWQQVQALRSGRAVFTQPPMPIKCAGAPQKALYLSCDHWLKTGVLENIEVGFYTAGGALFSVSEFVPALQAYIDKYRAQVHYQHNLVRVDGPAKRAWFERKDEQGNRQQVEVSFDMLHVCPPQSPPDFLRSSGLADAAGWLDVDPHTLRHRQFANVWGLGDAANSPNAKTAAAVRKQAPVVAANISRDIQGQDERYDYDGYGACPLTVERGKVVLAEFGYGGKLLPTFPRWLLDGTKATRKAWFIKEKVLPRLYWDGMLKGHEMLVKPRPSPADH